MKQTLTFIISVLLAMVAFAQPAQPVVALSTGIEGGTYHQMANELIAACQQSDTVKWRVNKSGGSQDNIDCLVNNQCNLAIIQADALSVLGQGNNALRVFQTLHPEEVHIVTLVEPRKVGGVMGIGAKPVIINDTLDLEGLKVGVWGGGAITASIINDRGDIKFIPVEFDDGSKAFEALEKRQIDAVLAMGGARITSIAKLSKAYKLVPFADDHIRPLSKLYTPATISYRNLGQSGVKTIAVPALMVTRNYTTGNVFNALTKLRSCMREKLVELESTAGNHAKWTDVKLPGMEGYIEPKWPMWEPAATKPPKK